MSNMPTPLCPTHNVELEWREGKYGPFWGCPKYRTEGCKYVLKPKTERVVESSANGTTLAAAEKEKIILAKRLEILRQIKELWSEMEKLL